MNMPITRIAAAMMMMMAAASGARAAERIVFATDWRAQAEHGGF